MCIVPEIVVFLFPPLLSWLPDLLVGKAGG